ncbi:MAG: SirB2 family protein [SAR324 cluster bacterium]|nr:SirB2 family protein [SAR324 cluster bacterium]MBL7036018.1 SirB2 family protein [SAR324 cluster bacterium]
MLMFVLTLHVIAVMLVIGTLFVQSLTVVFRLRLSDQQQIEGIQWVQRRVHQLIYYPILAVAVISGTYLTMLQERFSSAGNSWLHAKLTLLLILIVFGFINGRQIGNSDLRKPLALLVHIGIFFISAAMIYLALVKPF